MSDWDFLWDLTGDDLMNAMSSGGTADDWAYIERMEREREMKKKKKAQAKSKKTQVKSKKGVVSQKSSSKPICKKHNTILYIDGENISPKKAMTIVKVAKQQGEVFSQRVYGLQKDEYTKGWSEKAKEYDIEDVRISGGPEKDKIDKKIQKDVKREISWQKNVDIVCIATSDKGYVDTIKELRNQGKRVIVIGEEKAPEELRESCNKFVEV